MIDAIVISDKLAHQLGIPNIPLDEGDSGKGCDRGLRLIENSDYMPDLGEPHRQVAAYETGAAGYQISNQGLFHQAPSSPRVF
jgi:hypothetical protein